jgi:RNA polymerase sigma-70 factor (ECF subfamily)
VGIAVRNERSESTSHSLLRRIQQQEPAAWERFSQLYGPLVYRWCRINGLQEPDADDVIQDVFHAVFQGIARFQRETVGQSMRGWLWTITRNKICDHFRRRQAEPIASGGTAGQEVFAQLADMPELDVGPVESYIAELSQRALRFIQTEFEASTWQAFWAMAIEGRSAADTARQLGITTAAAFKAKSRVLNRLRRELDGLLD